MQAKIVIKPITYIHIVLLLFLVPLKWLFAWLVAAGIHEVCHLLAVRLCGGEVFCIKVGITGAEIKSSSMEKKGRLFAVLSGPLGGLLLLAFAKWIPRIAICSWFLSIYNLLPLLPLDGGRAIEILFGDKVYIFQKIFLILLSVGSVYAALILHLGLLPPIIVAVLWLKSRNFPCKQSSCKVQ